MCVTDLDRLFCSCWWQKQKPHVHIQTFAGGFLFCLWFPVCMWGKQECRAVFTHICSFLLRQFQFFLSIFEALREFVQFILCLLQLLLEIQEFIFQLQQHQRLHDLPAASPVSIPVFITCTQICIYFLKLLEDFLNSSKCIQIFLYSNIISHWKV